MSTEKKTAAPKTPKKVTEPKAVKPKKEKTNTGDVFNRIRISDTVDLPETKSQFLNLVAFEQIFTEMLLSEAKSRMVRRERASITPEDLEEIAKVITPKIVAIFKA